MNVLKPTRMLEVSIIVHEDRVDDALRIMGEYEIFHFKDISGSKIKYGKAVQLPPTFTRCTNLNSRLNRLISSFEIPRNMILSYKPSKEILEKKVTDTLLDEIEDFISKLERKEEYLRKLMSKYAIVINEEAIGKILTPAFEKIISTDLPEEKLIKLGRDTAEEILRSVKALNASTYAELEDTLWTILSEWILSKIPRKTVERLKFTIEMFREIPPDKKSEIFQSITLPREKAISFVKEIFETARVRYVKDLPSFKEAVKIVKETSDKIELIDKAVERLIEEKSREDPVVSELYALEDTIVKRVAASISLETLVVTITAVVDSWKLKWMKRDEEEDVEKLCRIVEEVVEEKCFSIFTETPMPIFFIPEVREAIESVITTEKYEKLKSFLEYTLSELRKHISDKEYEKVKARKEAEIRKLKEELQKLAKENLDKILEYKFLLGKEICIGNVKVKALKTPGTYLIKAFIPSDKAYLLEDLKEKLKGECIIKTKKAEHAPVKLAKRPSFMGWVSSLVEGYGIPDYREIDPTVFMLPTFIVIFGLMFGDVGHGILLLITGLVFRHLSKRNVKLPSILGDLQEYLYKGSTFMILGGISATIVGFLYGEIFGSGTEVTHGDPGWFHTLTGLEKPLWFSPVHDTIYLLKVSIVVGIVQITFGLLLRLITQLMNREFKEAIPSIAWLWLYTSGSYLVLTLGFDALTIPFSIDNFSLSFFYAPLAFLFIANMISHGVGGLMEALEQFISSFSHSISYARIMALALLHAVLAKVFLQFGAGLGTIGFIIGAAVGSIFILALESVICFMHTLRLHWVEWFLKFYKATGSPYEPFSLRNALLT